MFSASLYGLRNWGFENLNNSSRFSPTCSESNAGLLSHYLSLLRSVSIEVGAFIFLTGKEGLSSLSTLPLSCLFRVSDTHHSGCITEGPNSWLSKYGSWARSLSVTWNSFKAQFLRPLLERLGQKLWGWGPEISLFFQAHRMNLMHTKLQELYYASQLGMILPLGDI